MKKQFILEGRLVESSLGEKVTAEQGLEACGGWGEERSRKVFQAEGQCGRRRGGVKADGTSAQWRGEDGWSKRSSVQRTSECKLYSLDFVLEIGIFRENGIIRSRSHLGFYM